MVTPGGHRRFRPEDADGFPGRAETCSLPSELVSSREAARMLGVSQPTLNRAVREGRVRPAAVTPGGHRRFAAGDLADSRREAAQGASRQQGATSSWTGC
jgi:excisionase family DNA binding protein